MALIRDPLLTSTEAAELMGVKAQTLAVWRMNRSSDLAFIRVGRCIKYRTSAIEAFLLSRTVGATSPANQ